MEFYSCPKCKKYRFQEPKCDDCNINCIELKSNQITAEMYLDYLDSELEGANEHNLVGLGYNLYRNIGKKDKKLAKIIAETILDQV